MKSQRRDMLLGFFLDGSGGMRIFQDIGFKRPQDIFVKLPGQRQLAALDLRGNTGVFTGGRNTPETGSRVFEGGVTTGKMLARADVVDTLAETFQPTPSDRPARRPDARRGLFSAALLVLHPDHAPLTLRVDHPPTGPICALTDLHRLATTGDYARWLGHVPVLSDKERGLD
ncbi:DUF1028 domain-containing protein [Paracoccus sp. YLB-12]|uniref:DUF1028 domain-containing protein n=1 Tax=Paracoccus maritimus TaxID=2933292 RepID=A0ABT2KC83_9RHOB|nr:DUF1028 domain-containing protein [Paracoccus sp. YLB-12]MCT4334148.1 DUF1028 domain-containing protein [Paracoccus sp. YLB-12]